jgi:multidrug resistance efflux pump
MLRTVITTVFVLLLFSGAGLIVYWSMPQKQSDETHSVSVGIVKKAVKGLGRVEGVAEANLSFGRSGRLDEVPVTESQEVEVNDHLAKMNPSEVDAQIAQQAAELKAAEAKLDLVQVKRPPEVIKQAEEKLAQATDEIRVCQARLKALEDPPIPPPPTARQLEEQQFVIEKERQNLILAQTELRKLKSSPTSDELAIADANRAVAQTDLDGALRKQAEPGRKTEAQIAVDRAQAQLVLLQAQYDRVKRGPRPEEIEAATAHVALAQIQLDGAAAVKSRLEHPEKPPPAPFNEIEAARVALMQAKSKENAARAAVEELKRGPETPEVRLAEAARDKAKASLDWLTKSREGLIIRAPFSGIITHRYVEPGSMVTGTQPIVSIVDFTSKRVRAEFDILRLGEIKQGMHVELSSRALGKETLDGKIDKILGVGSRKLTNEDPAAPKGGEVAEMIITINEPTSDLKKQAYAVLRPGLRMDAEVTLDEVKNVIVAPKQYISQKDGKEYVMCLERKAGPGSAESTIRRDVSTGMRDDLFVEIKNGLSEGDVIVKPKPMNSR